MLLYCFVSLLLLKKTFHSVGVMSFTSVANVVWLYQARCCAHKLTFTCAGWQVIVGDQSHVYQYEAGGMSILGGVAFNVLTTTVDGMLPLDAVEKAIR